MEVPEGNTLCSYLKQAKMSSIFFSYKSGKQDGGTGPAWVSWHQWEGEEVGKGCKRVNMVQIKCTPVCRWKNDTC
jgi:hypothetical protein